MGESGPICCLQAWGLRLKSFGSELSAVYDQRLALLSPRNDLKPLDNISHQRHQHVKECTQFQFRKVSETNSRSCPTCDKTSDLIRLISRATSHLGTTSHSKESEQKRDNTGRSCFFVLSAIARSSARSCMQCLAAALNCMAASANVEECCQKLLSLGPQKWQLMRATNPRPS